jgi:hypothetical protein
VAVKTFRVDLDVSDSIKILRELGLQVTDEIPAHNSQFEEVGMLPAADTMVKAAIAKPGIGILKLEFPILRCRGKHQGIDVGLLPVQRSVRQQDFERVGIRFEGEHTAFYPDSEGHGERRIPRMSPNINSRIARLEERPKRVYRLLRKVFPSLLGMAPAGKIQLSLLREGKRVDIKRMLLETRLEAQPVKDLF